MHGMNIYGGERATCLIQSTRLQGACWENGGLQLLELQPVTSIETRSLLGNSASCVFYALPRSKHGTTCKGTLRSTAVCSFKTSTRVNTYSAYEDFVVSPSQPVAEVFVNFNVTVQDRQTSNQTSASLRPAVFVVIAIVVVFALFKNFAWPAVKTKRRSCVSRIVELAIQCYLPFQRTHVVLHPARIFPWDSESDGHIDELYTTATVTLYRGAEVIDSETEYW